MKTWWSMLFVSALSAGADLEVVEIPPGVTRLADVGVYRVAWQSYGKPEVDMPPGWIGHFTADSGVSYLPGQHVLGRDAILFHSPWRKPAGRMWVDYAVRLPDVRPIRLEFGITMRPDVAVPGKSDGVTFSVWLDDGRGFRPLVRQFWDKGEWKDYSLDLSSSAGSRIRLRFQVEPGPENNPSFDFSYFGEPRLVCGQAESGLERELEAWRTSRATRATEHIPLTRLANATGRGVVPSNLIESYSNTVLRDGDACRFVYRAADADIVWTWTPRSGTLDDVTVRVNGGPPFRPMAEGGLFFAEKPFSRKRVRASGGCVDSIRPTPDGRGIEVLWRFPYRGRDIPVTWKFGIRGKAFTVQVSCSEPVFIGFSLGFMADVPLRRPFRMPYLPYATFYYLPASRLFVGKYLDWTVSNASRCPCGEAEYDCRTDGRRNPLFESGYVCVSPCVDEVLPNLPHPPSPFREALAPRIMLDVWGLPNHSFRGEAENLRNLKDHGIDHLAAIIHVWQRYGYDVKLPDHIPANPKLGGDAGMIELGRAANEAGYLWAVHENYIDFYPDAPSYDPQDRVLRENGSPSPAWYNKGTRVQSFGLKCNKALKYARKNSPYIHRTYHTTAAYLDVHTCVPPWHQLDHEATQPFAAMARGKVVFDTKLFQYMRDTHGGPLFGEGHHQAFWAGRCDGVEAQVEGGEDHAPFLDFDLLKIHPQMVNHGMGYYERWFRTGYQTRWGRDAATAEQIDKYRAQEIAYGHAGFIGNLATNNVQWVAKEHHLMYPIQRLYGAARVTDVRYEVGGRMVRASVAIALGRRLRQRISYENGLTVWVNWDEEPWTVRGRVLPQWGFLAVGPDTEVWTASVNGRLADWAECPEYVFADARTFFSMPYRRRIEVRPELALLQPLEGGAKFRKFRIAYRWHVNQDLSRDAHCFVHFVHPAAQTGDHILFQQDHPLSKPTSKWRKGECIEDGPYTVSLPPDLPPGIDYVNVVIGLFDQRGRLPLDGVCEGDRRVLIGRILLERDQSGRIVRLRPADISEELRKRTARGADFTAHLNPDGTWIDFGKVATDGCVKVERTRDALLVYPYPDARRFKVALDLAALVPGADVRKAAVYALAFRTRRNLGEVPARVQDGRLLFEVGRPEAVCYRISRR